MNRALGDAGTRETSSEKDVRTVGCPAALMRIYGCRETGYRATPRSGVSGTGIQGASSRTMGPRPFRCQVSSPARCFGTTPLLRLNLPKTWGIAPSRGRGRSWDCRACEIPENGRV